MSQEDSIDERAQIIKDARRLIRKWKENPSDDVKHELDIFATKVNQAIKRGTDVPEPIEKMVDRISKTKRNSKSNYFDNPVGNHTRDMPTKDPNMIEEKQKYVQLLSFLKEVHKRGICDTLPGSTCENLVRKVRLDMQQQQKYCRHSNEMMAEKCEVHNMLFHLTRNPIREKHLQNVLREMTREHTYAVSELLLQESFDFILIQLLCAVEHTTKLYEDGLITTNDMTEIQDYVSKERTALKKIMQKADRSREMGRNIYHTPSRVVQIVSKILDTVINVYNDINHTINRTQFHLYIHEG
jgi:ArsR family metal-binding transcriptional regulator